MTHQEKLSTLRQAMSFHGIQAYFIPNSDPHQSEYLPEHWRIMPWLTGFSGSSGNVVVTADFAGVWTDSRYFIQAEQQLRGTGFELVKLTIPHTAEYIDWMVEHCPEGSSVGIDGNLLSLASKRAMETAFSAKKLKIKDVGNLIAGMWEDRPALPLGEIFAHEEHFAGKSRVAKLEALRQLMAEQGIHYHLCTALDEIAWIFNLRGTDVEYNPVPLAYALIDPCEVSLFIDRAKVPAALAEELQQQGIKLAPYTQIQGRLKQLQGNKPIYYEAGKTSFQLAQCIPANLPKMEGMHLSTRLKAIKNAREIEQIREVMVKDGVAMIRFLMWLEESVGKIDITEVSAADKLESFRAEQAHFVGPSFSTIAGYQGNGAIVHYRAEPETAANLHAEGIFLLDSGGQYLDGTTDITRTIALGPPSEEAMRDFTLVLKGHIAIATAIFPEGTRGYQIEGFARRALWAYGMNYGHGTGHGVGFFLNVHEGPQTLGTGASGRSATPFELGMLTSNEPGVYHQDRYGIRTENLILCVEHSESEAFGKFLAFETVTLCPIDVSLIDTSRLSTEELDWLNAYHDEVRKKLSPHLAGEEVSWLEKKTAHI
ncbi:MAG: aminopeptidase P family protein [Bacteroidota bacterium]